MSYGFSPIEPRLRGTIAGPPLTPSGVYAPLPTDILGDFVQ